MIKVSILFICYNHSKYVAEALRSVLFQEYVNYELVICDDASNDNTRAIIVDELKNCPPHVNVVWASQNTNIGLLANFNQGMAACSGDVIFAAAGDDISMLERVSTTMEVFSNNPRCMLVSSNYQKIDDTGQLLAPTSKRNVDATIIYGINPTEIYAGVRIPGATAAYRASLRDVFGPLNIGKHAEDGGYWVRALLAGEIHFISKPLVKYRVHGANLSNYAKVSDTSQARQRYLRVMLNKQHDWRQYGKDISCAVNHALISDQLAHHLRAIVTRDRELIRLKRFSIAVAPWRLWLAAAWRVMGCYSYSYARLWKILSNDFRVRVSRRKRARRWKQKFSIH